jgi:hypothetical protein
VPDSLDELRRRRTAQLERLVALDREIAALEGSPAAPEVGAPPLVGNVDAYPRDAEAILEQYREPAVSVAKEAKRGCLLLFAAAMALLFAGLAVMYFYIKARRGG